MISAKRASLCPVLRNASNTLSQYMLFHSWKAEFNMEQVKSADPDELLECAEEEILHFWPQGRLPHTDKDCRPVYVEKTGKIDVTGLLKICDMEKLLKWHVHCTENDSGALFQSITDKVREGKMTPPSGATTVNQGCNILDMEGFALSMFMGDSKEYLSRVSKISQDYYPETMGKMFIINAPVMFTAAWSVVQGWLDERTVNKIAVYGSDYKEALFKQLGGKDKTPVEYGGTWKPASGKGLFSAAVQTTTIDKSSELVKVVPIKQGERFLSRWWADGDELTYSVTYYPGKETAAVGDAGGEEVFKSAMVSKCTGPENITGVKHTPTEPEGTSAGAHLGVYLVRWENAHKGGWVSSGTRTVTYIAMSKNKVHRAASHLASPPASPAAGAAAAAESTPAK